MENEKDCKDCQKVKELNEYIQDLEEECENRSEHNRLLTLAITGEDDV